MTLTLDAAKTPATAVSAEPIEHPGLEGVVAAATKLSRVDGAAGRLTLAGYAVENLAPHASFEEVVHLLWRGHLPTAAELAHLKQALAERRELPAATVELLRAAAAAGLPAMDALRMAAGTLTLAPRLAAAPDDLEEAALTAVAAFPGLVGAYWRLRHGQEPVTPPAKLGLAAAYLFQLTGEEPAPATARALETYLNTVSDHGFNASTFTARVITSTGSDLVSALTGAIGALKGPLHGGAPGPALDMVFEIGTPERAEEVLRTKLDRGERLMGFGHRVYRVRDPRADVLAEAARRFYAKEGDAELYDLARHVEAAALRLLRERKPDRKLDTNVEFYTALVLHGIGLDTDLFTPTFAVGRVAGWIAHALEQRAEGRLIRPSSKYVGPEGRSWVPVGER
ncbi:MAG: citrate synthase/methylcitrate synthase [Acidobacteria bacterium]|nr:citrate synthase/methylcitrate synthase [Acidobacteriota bacterium]